MYIKTFFRRPPALQCAFMSTQCINEAILCAICNVCDDVDLPAAIFTASADDPRRVNVQVCVYCVLKKLFLSSGRCIWTFGIACCYFHCLCRRSSALQCASMGWLRVVASLQLFSSFAKELYKRDHILQKRPFISRSLIIVATPICVLCVKKANFVLWIMYMNLWPCLLLISLPPPATSCHQICRYVYFVR